jgi:hypothetical protein
MRIFYLTLARLGMNSRWYLLLHIWRVNIKTIAELLTFHAQIYHICAIIKLRYCK